MGAPGGEAGEPGGGGEAQVPRWCAWLPGQHCSFAGRAVAGGDVARLLRTACLIAAPVALFLREVGSDVAAPRAVLTAPSALLLCSPAVLLLAASLVSLVVTARTEPGFIPKGHEQHVLYVGGERPARVEHVVNGVTVASRWCSTCKIHRPPRAKHCIFCDSCVLRFDHHCPWVSNCVGLRNYRAFVLFVLSTCLLAQYVLAGGASLSLLLARQSPGHGLADALRRLVAERPLLAGLVLYAALAVLTTGNLIAYHLHLIATNVTTNESLTRPYDGANPYSEGIVSNWKHFLVAKQPLSLADEADPKGTPTANPMDIGAAVPPAGCQV